MPRLLQDKIHSDFSTGSGIWTGYRSQITGLWSQTSPKDDFNSHLIREFNRKINLLSIPTGVYISPYDAGFSYIGTGVLLS